MAPRSTALLLLALGIGCGSASGGSDAGASGGDAGASCVEPDRVCPADPPLPGSPCEGMLVCAYGATAMATCAGGTWLFDAGCDGSAACVAPLAEVCREPFAGALTDARIEIGPTSGAFRPFTDHEPITAELGGQGAMIAYRVRIDGTEVAPECVSVTATVTYDDLTPVASHRAVRLHCGQSLGMFDVLPDRPCDTRIHPVTVSVSVDGVGTTSATLDLIGTACRTL